MNNDLRIMILSSVLLILVMTGYYVQIAYATELFETGTGIVYSYGPGNLKGVLLNEIGSRLFVAYYQEGNIVEIDTINNMIEIDRYNVDYPKYMELSPDESFLYVISDIEPGNLTRIQLSNSQMDSIDLEGSVQDMAMSPDGTRMWVVHYTWPLTGDWIGDINTNSPPLSGRLTEINLATFTIEQTLSIDAVPVAVWYSPVSDRVFVLHALTEKEIEIIGEVGGISERVIGEWCRITIYDARMPGNLYLRPEELQGGGEGGFSYYPPRFENWTDSGDYLAVPNPAPYKPAFSLRVANAETLEIFDLYFPDIDDQPLGCSFMHKVPGQDILWASIAHGKCEQGWGPSSGNILTLINTVYPYDFQSYIVNEATDHIGEFAVSPDGSTLYLAVIRTGEIIVWSPD